MDTLYVIVVVLVPLKEAPYVHGVFQPYIEYGSAYKHRTMTLSGRMAQFSLILDVPNALDLANELFGSGHVQNVHLHKVRG